MVQLSDRPKRKQSQSDAATHQPKVSHKISPISPLARRSPIVQTKLTVNQPNDQYEQEADAVASAVTSTPAPLPQPDDTRTAPNIQRMEMDEEPIQRIVAEEETCTACQQNVLQRSPQTDEPIQRDGEGSPTVSSSTAATIRSPGAGSPLPMPVRQRIEPHVGANLSGVRVHGDRPAQQAASSLNARAFTHGNHIFLNRSESSHNLGLMAHESTHVVQQTALTGSRIQRRENPDPRPTATTAERSTTTPSGSSVAIPAAPPVEAVTPEPVRRPAEETAPAVQGRMPTAAPPENVAAPIAPAVGTARPDIALSIPEAPSRLSAAAQGRLDQAEHRAAQAATVTTDLPSAETNVGDARSAVTEPAEETQARAGEALIEALGDRPQPSPEIEELCENIRRIIREKRPPDEESLVTADPEEAASEAGDQLNQSIEGDVERVEGSYDQLDEPPQGEPAQEPEAIASPPEQVETPNIDAAAAIPDPIPPENLSLDTDVANSAAQIEEAGLNTEPARLAGEADPNSPIAAAQTAQAELTETAERAPAEVLAAQQESLAAASADMAALQEAALLALTTSRSNTVTGVAGQQTAMVGSEEQMRSQVSRQAQEIFSAAQSQVNTLLTPLQQNAMNKWEQGKTLLTTQFRQHLDSVAAWVEEEYGGVVGNIVEFFVGLPDWVTEEYDAAEEAFGDGVCNLIREISTEVNTVVAACEQIIENARQEINILFDNLPEELQGWAEEQKAQFGEQLDGLQNQVTEAQQNLTEGLVQNASQAVQEVREEVHALREAAKGLLGRLADAVDAFLEDPAKFIIEGLLSVLGIAASAFWAVVNKIDQAINDIANDPENFTNNLLNAIGQGFEQFFDNFADHMLNGLLEWLFSGLGSVGVELPSDFSLSSIITFFLQLMGISWERIRQLLARHLGEENVALLEKAYELIANLVEMGPEGIFELIKEQLDPQAILDQVLEAAVDFLVEALIKAVSIRVIALFNPVGAIFQAIEAIYKVLKWIFENAARIFTLVETVVNGISNIISGDIGGMATNVEESLAGMIAPAVDFLAGFLGVGDLPDKIADKIKGFQDWIEGIVIGWLADRVKAFLRAIGIGGEEDSTENPPLTTDSANDATEGTHFGSEQHTLRVHMDETGNISILMASEGWGDFKHTIRQIRERYVTQVAPDRQNDFCQEMDRIAAQSDEYKALVDRLPKEQRIGTWRSNYLPDLDAEITNAALDFGIGGVGAPHQFNINDQFIDKRRNERMVVTDPSARQGTNLGLKGRLVNSHNETFFSFSSYNTDWEAVNLAAKPAMTSFGTYGGEIVITQIPMPGGQIATLNPPGLNTLSPSGVLYNRRGHLIANMFGGPNNANNIVAQTEQANHDHSVGMPSVENKVRDDVNKNDAAYKYKVLISPASFTAPPDQMTVYAERVWPTNINPPNIPRAKVIPNL